MKIIRNFLFGLMTNLWLNWLFWVKKTFLELREILKAICDRTNA